jgi:hypothetical protein
MPGCGNTRRRSVKGAQAVTRSSLVDGLRSLSAAELKHTEPVTSGKLFHEYPQRIIAMAALSSGRRPGSWSLTQTSLPESVHL